MWLFSEIVGSSFEREWLLGLLGWLLEKQRGDLSGTIGSGQVRHEDRPSSRDQPRAQEQEALGHVRRPEGAGCFEAEVDDPSNGTFDPATSYRKAPCLKLDIGHPSAMLLEVRKGRDSLLAHLSPQGLEHDSSQLGEFPFPQKLFPGGITGVCSEYV